MLLEIDDLTVNYGTAHALKGVSLTVGEGEVVALIGANGAGKTTLLRTISGLKTPRSGHIVFQGKHIESAPAYDIVKRGVAHIPEGRIVFGPMSVYDNLRMGAYLRKDKKAVAADLERVYSLFPQTERTTQATLRESFGG